MKNQLKKLLCILMGHKNNMSSIDTCKVNLTTIEGTFKVVERDIETIYCSRCREKTQELLKY